MDLSLKVLHFSGSVFYIEKYRLPVTAFPISELLGSYSIDRAIGYIHCCCLLFNERHVLH